ncbi:family 20 glycosylhydrolase [Pedobacter nutrimenti]|uniref:beta-N-acetylhexosaminidase n=1 Tax=Pedobacter nutrimenti TaxID=1241337 RepID=A0A318UHG1_9SPHI|nr:family 20 glycosylhydrolase [Pedobacter nutrimenti]PYF75583.1 hexosaminidase [Pedobacter nutrimenti]
MPRTFCLFFLLLAFKFQSFAQFTGKTLNQLHIRWEILENGYKNEAQTRSVLHISTSKNWKLPAKGWKIYFNFARPIKQQLQTSGLNIKHLNGDFFALEPGADFKGLARGASLKIEFVSGDWVVSATDAPSGFYLVLDNWPERTFSIPDVKAIPSVQKKQIARTAQDQVPFTNASILYAQNSQIKDLEPVVKIFPTPVSYTLGTGAFNLDASVNIHADPSFGLEKKQLETFISSAFLPGKKKQPHGPDIQLLQKQMPEEAYELQVSSTGIRISAASATGIFYGIQSLKTLLPPVLFKKPQKKVQLQALNVYDEPRFGHRAFMLDVARNFQQKKQVLKLLDLMALYKLNVLHFHLNDDEGWRLEIPALPELTSYGSKRGHDVKEKNHLQPSLGSGPDANNPYGSGYYSKADFIEILKYANERHIRVIPEIESPGHARAAVKAMEARNDPKYLLSEKDDLSAYRSVQYWNDNVMNVALPSVYNFIETITTEIQAMYRTAGAPLKTIHYGGDEVPTGVWEKSPAVKALMKQDSTIKTADDLWGYYYGKVNNILQKHGLYLSAWEEAGTRKIDKDGKKETIFNEALLGQNLHLEVWNNMMGWGAEDLAYRLANKGYKVIFAGVTNLYFDMAYYKSFDEPGYYWGGYVDVDKPFSLIPYDYYKNTSTDRMGNTLPDGFFKDKQRLTEEGRKNIVGLQGALFSEVSKGPVVMEYLILPKMLGLAERAWAKDPDWAKEKDAEKSSKLYQQSWSEFLGILGKRELPRLDYYAGGFQYRIPLPGAIIKDGAVQANVQIPGLQIRYTTDGSAPTAKSKRYTTPLKVKGKITLAAFNQNGRSGKSISILNP